MTLLRAEGLRKHFGDHQVLRGLDLSVAEGEAVCLIGASGSGKSTLLRCLNLLEPVTDGTVWFDGRQLLERFGLAEKVQAYPDSLSGGQQQRVALVQALAMRPRILLLDEITSALDPELVGEVLDAIKVLRGEGLTVVMATHEMGFARDVADRVAFLHDGVVLEEGPASTVLSTPAHERTATFLRRFLTP